MSEVRNANYFHTTYQSIDIDCASPINEVLAFAGVVVRSI